jgi:hypothetical protein
VLQEQAFNGDPWRGFRPETDRVVVGHECRKQPAQQLETCTHSTWRLSTCGRQQAPEQLDQGSCSYVCLNIARYWFQDEWLELNLEYDRY